TRSMSRRFGRGWRGRDVTRDVAGGEKMILFPACDGYSANSPASQEFSADSNGMVRFMAGRGNGKDDSRQRR
ncbi:MAG: hypothetical protein ACXVDF_22945, partial [Ktedonobacterales bacterium]